MRRCPECFESYGGSEKFCDNDGTPLVEIAVLPLTPAPRAAQSNDTWAIATLGVVVGVVLSLIIGAFVFAMLREDGVQPREDDERPAATQRSAPLRPAQLASTLLPEATPTPAESPTPEAAEESAQQTAPTPAVAEPSNKPAPARLNKGPVSTSAGATDEAGGQSIVQLKNGTQIEVDAVWEDGQGIWYKRGALVTFVERSRVEAVNASRPQPETTPTPAAP